MRYFMFSPIEMDEYRAFQLAKPHLRSDSIVHVSERAHWFYTIDKGQRPRAASDTYLVRVEPDDSLRVVDRNLT